MNRSRGFTLIEMMITIAIFSLLMTMGVQMTQSWVDSAQQRDAENLLKQGISRAKATALRNPSKATADCPAVMLSKSGQNLKLYLAQDNSAYGSTCTAMSTTASWEAKLPSNAALTSGSTAITCVAFNSRGLPVAGDSSCATSTISVTAGSESAVNVEII